MSAIQQPTQRKLEIVDALEKTAKKIRFLACASEEYGMGELLDDIATEIDFEIISVNSLIANMENKDEH